MLENEVFKISPTFEEISPIIEESIKYAILSINFTQDNTKKGYEDRLGYVVLGRVPQFILINYMLKQNIPVDFKTCDTPYFLPDKRDFIIDKTEFDIKCFSIKETYQGNYLDIPALCPTKQFKQGIKNIGVTNRVAYIYAFTKKNWFSIHINKNQRAYLLKLLNDFKKIGKYSDPEDVYKTFTELGDNNKINYSINLPEFVFCGYSTIDQWNLFTATINQGFPPNNPAIFVFMDNMAAPMEKLPSFKSYIDSFKIKEIPVNKLDTTQLQLEYEEFENAKEFEAFKKYDTITTQLQDIGMSNCGSYYEGLEAIA